ncbi:hypothetical protein CDL15_Pgr018648 [Punica granatum]|nr:hypothetical protein CDL15_Pgr018648 [Punica granatum]
MAPKGDNVLDWNESMELAFIHVLLEKFRRTHTTSWKQKDWEEMNAEMERQFPGVQLGIVKLSQECQRLKTTYKLFYALVHHTGVCWDMRKQTLSKRVPISGKNENYETFRSKGCKHYKLLCELFSSSTATCAFRISSTDPPRTAKRCGKQQVNLEEWSDESDDPWSDESDDPVHVVEEPIISESRRGVHERQSSRSSQLQECMELFKASFESRSESVSNKERHSIEAAMADLNELKSTVSMKEYLAGSLALKEETMRQVFMCYPEDARRAWLQTLIPN